MQDLFGEQQEDYKNFTVFQDESGCKKSNYFYHGFLFIDNEHGRDILDELIDIKKKKNKRWTEIHFHDIQNSLGYKTEIALEWLNLVKIWLVERKIKFYFFGINKHNMGNFWKNDWHFDKNIYLKSFGIGFDSAMEWFKKDERLSKPLNISHLLYEYGPYGDERKAKINWLNIDFSKDALNCRLVNPIFSDEKRQLRIKKSFAEFSNLIQLTDLLVGVCRCSFIKINPDYKGRQACVKNFIDVIERFNNKNIAYNNSSKFYKSFCLGFFPGHKINQADFFGKTKTYLIKAKDNFYCDRETYQQFVLKKSQIRLNL